MTNPIIRPLIVGSLLSALGLAGCVSQSKYDDLQAQNDQLQQQNAALSQQLAGQKAQIGRLQGAIKYTVNSDLLFASGSWEMRPQGKQIIARMAAKLAPTQQNKILVMALRTTPRSVRHCSNRALPQIWNCRKSERRQSWLF